MSSPVNDCVGIDEAVDVVLCWRAFVAGTIAGVCVCVEWIVHSVFGLLCIWRQVEALIDDGQVPPLATILGPLIPPEANWGHRPRLST